MADETPKPAENQNPPPAAPAVPPKSTDIVGDNHAKSIRDMETKLAASERATQELKAELKTLEEIVKKAGEIKTPVVTEKPISLLEHIENFLFIKK